MRTMTRSFMFLAAGVASTLTVAASCAVAAPIATDESFGPRRQLDQGQLELDYRHAGMHYRIFSQWRGANRVRTIEPYRARHGQFVNISDAYADRSISGTGSVRALRDGLVRGGEYRVAPDGTPELQTLLLDYAWPAITRQRSGQSLFRLVRSRGRMVLRARTAEPAIGCVRLPAGTRTIELDPRTFVPLRVLVVRARKLDLRIDTVRLRAAAGTMPAIRYAGRHRVIAGEFIPATPAEVLTFDQPFDVAMPTYLPQGFSLELTGMAASGSSLGADGVLPESGAMYAAQWRRGLETIDLTIRTGSNALTSKWDTTNPFGYACSSTRRISTTVAGHAGSYTLGAFGGARLWWRDGATMYTLTAPLSRAELVRVAESLANVRSTSALSSK